MSKLSDFLSGGGLGYLAGGWPGAILGGLSASGAGSRQGNTTTTMAPWGPAQPYYEDIFRQASRLNTAAQPYYSGPMVPDLTPYTKAASNYLASYAGGVPQSVGAANQGISTLLNAPNVSNNPYLMQAMQASIRPVTESLQQDILPQLGSIASRLGAYGSTAHQNLIGRSVGDAVQAMIDRTATMGSQAYGQGLTAAGQGASLVPQTLSAGALPAYLLQQASSPYDDYARQWMGNEYNRWQYNTQQPWQNLGSFANLLSTAPGGQQTTPYFTNPLMQGLGGGMAAGGLADLFKFGGNSNPGVSSLFNNQNPIDLSMYGRSPLNLSMY